MNNLPGRELVSHRNTADATGLLLFAFASQGWMMFIFLIPYCLGGKCTGRMQDVLTGLISITSIIGPQVMTGLFAYFTKTSAPVRFSGASFLLGAVLMFASAFIAYKSLRLKGKITTE